MASTAQSEILIDLPVAAAWEKLRDLSIAHAYVPNLTGVQFVGEQRTGVGTARLVLSKNRPPMTETVVEWLDGTGFTLRLTNGEAPPAPFREASFTYRIEDAGQGRTRFLPSLTYTLPGGPLGALLDALLFRRMMRGMTRQIATNLKGFYETGKPTNPEYKG